jgi:predicted regulator of Ras-like GTPase activity (Roadblock/LC7/MglB family)
LFTLNNQTRIESIHMVTRQSELIRVLGNLAADLPNPLWVALVDNDGLVVASVPPDPPAEPEAFSAMTAASVMMGERVLNEIAGGNLRYTSVAGSDRQLLTVALSRERLLSIGLGPEVPPHDTFGPLSRRVPELLKALKRRFGSEE